MGKRSNGALRAARLRERAERKGVELDRFGTVVQPTNGYAYVYGSNGRYLTQKG